MLLDDLLEDFPIYPYANVYIYETIEEFLAHYESCYDWPGWLIDGTVYWNKDIGIFEVFSSPNMDHEGYVFPWVSLTGKPHFASWLA